MLILLILSILAVYAIVIIIMTMNNNKKVKLLIKEEPSFRDAKSFDGPMGRLLIAESGHIGLISTIQKTPRIIHINNINGFEIVTNEKNKLNVGAAVAGGFLFGGAGALIGALGMKKDIITSLYLDFKLNDWDSPSIQFYLMMTKAKSNGFMAKQMIQSAGQICNLLEQLEVKYKDTVSV